MPSDLPDVWRDEDGPSPVETDRWTSGELAQLTLNPDGRRLVRQALKTLYETCTNGERRLIDQLLDDLKH